jgi:hypothetical protein
MGRCGSRSGSRTRWRRSWSARAFIVEIDGRDTVEEALVLGDEVRSGRRCSRSSACSWLLGGDGSVSTGRHLDKPVTWVK